MPLTLASNAITFTDNTTLSSGVIGTAQLSAGAVTGEKINRGYLYLNTLYYVTPGISTFIKTNYPWLRAIRVKCQGGGGGGGGCVSTGVSQMAVGGSGGGGAYAESFITDINSLSSSITITVGAGGAGGAAGNNAGTVGSPSSFSTLVTASGGLNGTGGEIGSSTYIRGGNSGGLTGRGDIVIPGQHGGLFTANQTNAIYSAAGGSSILGVGAQIRAALGSGLDGDPAYGGYGGGGGGAINAASQGTSRVGGAGGGGAVLVELYA